MNPAFIDVDFTKEKEYVAGYYGDGRNPELKGYFRDYANEAPLIPQDRWQACSEEMDQHGGGCERFITRIFNQSQEGSCVGNASTQSIEIIDAKQVGKDRVTQLSAISLYKQIGSGPMSGAMVDDAWRKLQEVGVLPLDTPENRAKFGEFVMPHTGFYTPWPKGDWKAVAANFKAYETLEIRGVQALVSASFQGHPVVVGRAGHSICYVRPVFKDGKLYMKYVNSWGQWGDAGGDFKYGFGYDSMNLISSSAQWAFAVRSKVLTA